AKRSGTKTKSQAVGRGPGCCLKVEVKDGSESDEGVVRHQENVSNDHDRRRQQPGDSSQQKVVEVHKRPIHVDKPAEYEEGEVGDDQIARNRPHPDRQLEATFARRHGPGGQLTNLQGQLLVTKRGTGVRPLRSRTPGGLQTPTRMRAASRRVS